EIRSSPHFHSEKPLPLLRLPPPSFPADFHQAPETAIPRSFSGDFFGWSSHALLNESHFRICQPESETRYVWDAVQNVRYTWYYRRKPSGFLFVRSGSSVQTLPEYSPLAFLFRLRQGPPL